MSETKLGGRFTFPGTSLTVHRMGYGAMQLAGPGVFGPPKDPDEAVAVLREAVAVGRRPHRHQRLLRPARHQPDHPAGPAPVPRGPGDRHQARGASGATDASWQPAISRKDDLIAGVHDNLSNLGLDALDVVNLPRRRDARARRRGPSPSKVEVLADLQRQGLIRHVGLSNVTAAQVAEAQAITEIVCVQNLYNLAHRHDDAFIDDLARQGIPYVPFFPLGGFTPLQSSTLSDVAGRLGATPMQVALAWLLHRSPNILLIPGTSSRGHLRENLAAAELTLPADALAELDGIAAAKS